MEGEDFDRFELDVDEETWTLLKKETIRLKAVSFVEKTINTGALSKVGIQVNAYTLFSTMLFRYAKGMDKDDENR